MKKMFLFITINIALFSVSSSQSTAPDNQNNNGYEMNAFLSKAKKQKTSPWVCQGGGLVLATTGMANEVANVTADIFGAITTLKETQEDNTGESLLMLPGGAGILSYLPIFIASGKNKQKTRLRFTNQKTIGLIQGVSKKIPGLTLSLYL